MPKLAPKRRRVKIIATLGPASDSLEMLRALFHAGVNVFRLNSSHGTQKDKVAQIERLRQIEKEAGRPLGILLDLQGPKLRTGILGDAGLELEKGARLDLTQGLQAAPGAIPIPQPELFSILSPGQRLLLDDGRLVLRILKVAGNSAQGEVVVGGTLASRKGINLPDAVIPLPALTPKDLEDLSFARKQDIDWIACSFVQRAQDIAEVRALARPDQAVMAKIERPSALDDLPAIIQAADGVMVARGDLGVELSPELVPSRQRAIVRACRSLGRPVVVATQMLETMINSPSPTRAEASDVATAVFEGADAVMLSGETAVGQYPVETAAMMERIIVSSESDKGYIFDLFDPQPQAAHEEMNQAEVIAQAAAQLADHLPATAIACYTMSGSTALRVAQKRPSSLLLVMTSAATVARRLTVLWGVYPVVTEDVASSREMMDKACRIAREEKLAATGETIVVTAGVPFGTPGRTNLIRVGRLD